MLLCALTGTVLEPVGLMKRDLDQTWMRMYNYMRSLT